MRRRSHFTQSMRSWRAALKWSPSIPPVLTEWSFGDTEGDRAELVLQTDVRVNSSGERFFPSPLFLPFSASPVLNTWAGRLQAAKHRNDTLVVLCLIWQRACEWVRVCVLSVVCCILYVCWLLFSSPLFPHFTLIKFGSFCKGPIHGNSHLRVFYTENITQTPDFSIHANILSFSFWRPKYWDTFKIECQALGTEAHMTELQVTKACSFAGFYSLFQTPTYK